MTRQRALVLLILALAVVAVVQQVAAADALPAAIAGTTLGLAVALTLATFRG